MTNTEFQNKVLHGCLTGQKANLARILVEMKIYGETMSGDIVTSNDEDAIHNTVLVLNN